MKKIITQTFLLLLFATVTNAHNGNTTIQTPTDTIRIKKIFGGYQFYNNGEKLKLKELEQLLKTNEQATKEYKSSKTSGTFSAIIGFAGGFLIGWPLGTAIAGGKPNWALAGIGAGLTAVSIPLSNSSNKRVVKAVKTYNQAQQSSSFKRTKELNLQITNNGIGLAFKI